MILGKVAFGFGGMLLLAGAYTFHEGVIRVSVDEDRQNGDHIHVVVPEVIVPVAMRFVPAHDLDRAVREARPYMPMLEALSKELSRLPDFELVSVDSPEDHVRIRTEGRRLMIDVREPGEAVHISCPLATLRHLAENLRARKPIV